MLRVVFKLPAYLAAEVRVPMEDGVTVRAPVLMAGDVDGNNVVDEADRRVVTEDAQRSAGGPDAGSVPASDANGDGRVSGDDTALVTRNLGQRGAQVPVAP